MKIKLVSAMFCAAAWAISCVEQTEVEDISGIPSQPLPLPVPDNGAGETAHSPIPARPVLPRLDGERQVTIEVLSEEDLTVSQPIYAPAIRLPFNFTIAPYTRYEDVIDIVPMADGAWKIIARDWAGSFMDVGRGSPVIVGADGEMSGRESFITAGYAGLGGWQSWDWKISGTMDSVTAAYTVDFTIGAGYTKETIEPVYRLVMRVAGEKRYKDFAGSPAARADGHMLARVSISDDNCGEWFDRIASIDVIAQDEQGSRVRLRGTRLPEIDRLPDGRVEQNVLLLGSHWHEGELSGAISPTELHLRVRLDRYSYMIQGDQAYRGEYLCSQTVNYDGRRRYAEYDASGDSSQSLAGERNVSLELQEANCPGLDFPPYRTLLDVRVGPDGSCWLQIDGIYTPIFVPAADGSFSVGYYNEVLSVDITLSGNLGRERMSYSISLAFRGIDCRAVYVGEGWRRSMPRAHR